MCSATACLHRLTLICGQADNTRASSKTTARLKTVCDSLQSALLLFRKVGGHLVVLPPHAQTVAWPNLQMYSYITFGNRSERILNIWNVFAWKGGPQDRFRSAHRYLKLETRHLKQFQPTLVIRNSFPTGICRETLLLVFWQWLRVCKYLTC